jgi:LuxR family maltose regulon positive regulatory protein
MINTHYPFVIYLIFFTLPIPQEGSDVVMVGRRTSSWREVAMTALEKETNSSREAISGVPLLATKLHIPPVRPNLVSRSQLLNSIPPSCDNRLILLSAPAGFGKTTLLSDWLATHPWPTGWVSLDRGDNDPARFWTYVIAALQTIQPGLGESAKTLLYTTGAGPMEPILTVLINELDSAGITFLLVFDDYHAINNPVIHSTMTFFLDHLPRGVHVAIATRADPPLGLAHLRANGSLLELRIDKLRFTREETSMLLNEKMKLGLAASDIEILVERTEGWIVGLQLAALSLQAQTEPREFVNALSGNHRYILDYLVEEVLNLQTGDIQAFLLKTSILDRMCGPLCDAVLADPGAQNGIDGPASGQDILEKLDKANLFIIPLDNERKWYRYHHLFADLLRIRLEQSYEEKQVETLHARAADWFEANRLPAEAIEHALAAHKPEQAARVIERYAGEAWLHGEFYQVLRWIEVLPKALAQNRPWVCVWQAWSQMQAGTAENFEELINHAEQEAAIPEYAQDEALREQIAALRVTSAGVRYKTEKTIELARRALEQPVTSQQAAALMARTNVLNVLGFAYYMSGELAHSEETYREARKAARGSDFVMRELLVVHKLAHIRQVLGYLHDPYQLCQESLTQLKKQGRQTFFAAGYLYCDLAHILMEWNRLDEAEWMIVQSARLNELTQVPHLTIDTCNAQARYALARGNLETAQAALQQADELIQKHYCWPEVVAANECYQVKLWLANGDLQSAARWAEHSRAINPTALNIPDEMREIARARVYLARGQTTEALSLLGRLAAAAEAGGRNGRLIEILGLQARGLSKLHAGKESKKIAQPELELVEKSLDLAKPEGFIRLYLDEGPVMAALLRQAATSGAEPDYAKKLLEAFSSQMVLKQGKVTEAQRHAGMNDIPSVMIEPLSERELEVLRLMALGKTNLEIARQLIVAIGTVKAHAASIYRKLDATNRTEAVAHARQLGILF